MTANPEAFEAYFQVADTDRDGRISGAEAVAFFQGSGLPQLTLAKIWQHADTGQTGYLQKAEFFNALKLVTVAQSGRELTPELVRSALVGPAASLIPPPKMATATLPQAGVPGAGMVMQQVPSAGGNTPRPSQPPAQFPGPEVRPGSAGLATEAARFAGPRPSMPDASSALLFGNLGIDAWVKPSAGPASGNVKQEVRTAAPVTTHSMHDVFPDGEFKATPAGGGNPGVAAIGTTSVSSVSSTVSANVPDSKGSTSTVPTRSNANTPYGFDAMTAYNLKPSSPAQGSRPAQNQGPSSGLEVGDRTPRGTAPNVSAVQATQPVLQPGSTAQSTAPSRLKQTSGTVIRQSFALPAWEFGGEPDGSDKAESAWPKMTRVELERYLKMFLQLDTDRDGKIAGAQARDLFLGWRLPMDMLKQVWDLADQDVDGMLSQREFCTAMYFIERFREGRPVPLALPTGIFLEDAFPVSPRSPGQVPLSGQTVPGAQTITAGVPAHIPPDGGAQVLEHQKESKVPVLDQNIVSQLPREERETLTAKQREAKELEQQVLEAEKATASTALKIDYYRAKLQELVSKSMFRILFKTRSEKELFDLNEKVAADKRELEVLPRKFDEKIKELNDANARLVAQDEGYRDIQRRKAELSNAISKLEQADTKGDSQARADRLWSELDELRKTYLARCQQLGLRVPHGQAAVPGVPYGHAEPFTKYDGYWDKFHDEEPARSAPVSRSSPIPSGGGRPGVDQSHQEFRSQNYPVGKSNLGIPATSSRPIDTHHVFGEPEVFDWRDVYREENEAGSRPKGRCQDHYQAPEQRETSQASARSEVFESRGRDRPQLGHEDHSHRLTNGMVDRSGVLQKDSAAHGSPIFSSSPMHPKLAPGVSGHQDVQSGPYGVARYDDDPFAGMGPFGSN